MNDKPELVAEFNCPVCGSKERFCESLAKEMKEKGWMHPELNYYAQIWQGAIYDKSLLHKIPIGSKVPAYFVYLDVCMGCGNVYAVKLERGTGVYTGSMGKPPGAGAIDIPDSVKKALKDIDFSKLDKGVT